MFWTFLVLSIGKVFVKACRVFVLCLCLCCVCVCVVFVFVLCLCCVCVVLCCVCVVFVFVFSFLHQLVFSYYELGFQERSPSL